MKIVCRFVLFVALVGVLLGPNLPAAAQGTNALVDGNTAFALDLFARLKTTPGNLFFSPYSISTCLAIAYAGARGTTAAQMGHVLHWSENQARVNAGFSRLQGQLKQAEQQQSIELKIANGLWAQQGHPFLPGFLNVALQEFGANLKAADFKTGADAATREINQWVSDATKNKIQDILAPGALTPATRLVLANAIYFKGAWADPFDKSRTRPQPFYLTPTRRVNTPFMSRTDMVPYLENQKFQAVELRYSGHELSLVILLPRTIEGCRDLENSLTPANLRSWLGQLGPRKVELYIPRFKLESGLDLHQTLTAMGLTEAFSTKADFSGIDGTHDLFISSVAHKAWVDVNEEGTEAAASTVVGISATAVQKRPVPPPVFRADHPFIFLIRDTRSGSILFLGRLAQPVP